MGYFAEENRGKHFGGAIGGLLLAGASAGLGYYYRVDEEKEKQEFFKSNVSNARYDRALQELRLKPNITNELKKGIDQLSSGGVYFNFYGPQGVGKTHIAEALPKAIKEKYGENVKIDTYSITNDVLASRGGIFAQMTTADKLREILIELSNEVSDANKDDLRHIKYVLFDEANILKYDADQLKDVFQEFTGKGKGVMLVTTCNSSEPPKAFDNRRAINIRFSYPDDEDKKWMVKQHAKKYNYQGDTDNLVTNVILKAFKDPWKLEIEQEKQDYNGPKFTEDQMVILKKLPGAIKNLSYADFEHFTREAAKSEQQFNEKFIEEVANRLIHLVKGLADHVCVDSASIIKLLKEARAEEEKAA